MLYQKWEGSLFHTKQNKYSLQFPLIYKIWCKIILFSKKDIWKYKKCNPHKDTIISSYLHFQKDIYFKIIGNGNKKLLKKYALCL